MHRLPFLAFSMLTGCVFGLGPLPVEVNDLGDYLRRQNLQLAVANVAYDRAFERVVEDAHVVTYEVSAPQPTSERARRAFVDVFMFASDAEAEQGLAGLQRIHDRGNLYADGRLVLYVRGGDVPDLRPALARRFGTPRSG